MNLSTPEQVAETIERIRYGLVRSEPWEELRESERAARVDLLTRALDGAGLTGEIVALQRRADESDQLAALVATRETELALAIAARETDLRRERQEHDAAIVRLSDQVAALRSELDASQAHEASANERADAAWTALDTMRAALATADAVSPPPGTPGTPTPHRDAAPVSPVPAAAAAASSAPQPAPRGRFSLPRLAANPR
ncbi:MAG: hypothetical protein HGA44_15365 [Cellulomonadaceae bacterium]|nr:hypothetical protein [Cellulomonadaceae bacterium]